MELSGGFLGFVVPFLVVLTALVFVHELGHYLVARWNGVRVEVFSIGFGPEIFGWTDRTGTRWKFSLVPLGGYVKMFGDANAASMPADDNADMSEAERAVAFPYKRLGQRTAIVAAGPIANFIFAIVLLAGLFSLYGQPFTPAVVGEVIVGSAAEEAGFAKGDEVIAVNGQSIERFEELQRIVALRPGEELSLSVIRGGETIELKATPARVMRDNGLASSRQSVSWGSAAAAPTMFSTIRLRRSGRRPGRRSRSSTRPSRPWGRLSAATGAPRSWAARSALPRCRDRRPKSAFRR